MRQEDERSMERQTPIDFAVHEVRRGAIGARDDFEMMVTDLWRAINPAARRIQANPGDWGIDVVVGDFDGQCVEVCQCKFFHPITKEQHQRQIRDSFEAAIGSAQQNGYCLSKWILCVPSSMDAPTDRWWRRWKARSEEENQISIELWDETELRRMLYTDAAVDVRKHYFGTTIFSSRVTGVSSEKIQQYLQSLVKYTSYRLHELVPLTLTLGDGVRGEVKLSDVLSVGQNAQLLGISGCGKTHLVSHSIVTWAKNGWIPIYIRGLLYRGDLTDLLDTAVGAHVGCTASELFRGAANIGSPTVVVVDGINECGPNLRRYLIDELSSLRHRNKLSVLLVGHESISVPDVLAGYSFVVQELSEKQRNRILESYGASGNLAVDNAFVSALDVSLAARVSGQGSRSRAELYDSYIHERLSAVTLPNRARAVLRLWAKYMDSHVTMSLDEGIAERIALRNLSLGGLDSAALESALMSPIIKRRRGRLFFSHEQFGRFLAAEELVLSCSSENLLAELNRPRHWDLAEFALALEPEQERVMSVILGIRDHRVIEKALRGRISATVRRAVETAARGFLNSQTKILRSVAIGVESEFAPVDVDERVLVENEKALLSAIGHVIYDGQLFEESIALLRETDFALQRGNVNSDHAGLSAASMRAAVLDPSLNTGRPELAGAVLLGQAHSSLSDIPSVPVGVLKAVLDELTEVNYSVAFLLCSLIRRTDAIDVARLAPELLKKCLGMNAYHVTLSALEMIQGVRRSLPESDHTGVVEVLNDLLDSMQGKNVMLSSFVLEILDRYSPIDHPYNAEEIVRQIGHIIENYGEDYCDMASAIYSNQFESIIGDVHCEAIGRLSDEQREKFLIAAASSMRISLFASSILADLIELDSPLALSSFERWAEDLSFDTPVVEEPGLCFFTALRGCARWRSGPPGMLVNEIGDIAEAWRAIGELVFWVHRSKFWSDDDWQRCLELWTLLCGDLAGCAADPLRALFAAQTFQHDNGSDFMKLVELFPREIRLAFECQLDLLGQTPRIKGLSGIVLNEQDWLRLIANVLGCVGTENSIEKMTPYVDHPFAGEDVINAIRKIRMNR